MLWQGTKIFLRPLKEGDFPALVRWNNDPELQKLMDADYPLTLEECRDWFSALRRNPQHRLWAILDSGGELIGEVELQNIAWRRGEAELRIRIGEKAYWNKGYGTDVIRTLLTHAFAELKLRSIYLRVYRFNRRAIHCYLKCGFRIEGFLRLRHRGRGKEILLMRVSREHFLGEALSV